MNLRPRRKDAPELNLAPLIDVVFLLLIFFMVSMTFDKQSQLKLDLPKAMTQHQQIDSKDRIEIHIDAKGTFVVDDVFLLDEGSETDNLKMLIKRLGEISAGNKQMQVSIRADAETPHRFVVRAMDAASQSGLLRISIPTQLIVE